MRAKPVMLLNNALLAFAAAVLAFLPGCVGVPQTFYEAEPATPQRSALPRLSLKPAPVPTASPLSDSDKRRLFQDFQHSQSLKDQAATAQEPVP